MSELIIGDGWTLPNIHYQAFICEGAKVPFSDSGTLASEQQYNLENLLRYHGYANLKVELLDKDERIYYRYRISGDSRELVHFKLKFSEYLTDNEKIKIEIAKSRIFKHMQKIAVRK